MANMEVTFRANPQLVVKVECRDVEEMFQTVGPLQEVLGACKCGKCGSQNIRLNHRKADGKYNVYELICQGELDNGLPCRATLALGQNDLGNLFPRRYSQVKGDDGKWRPELDADGKKVWLPDNGWVRWNAKEKKFV